jgi:transposase-like protein
MSRRRKIGAIQLQIWTEARCHISHSHIERQTETSRSDHRWMPRKIAIKGMAEKNASMMQSGRIVKLSETRVGRLRLF